MALQNLWGKISPRVKSVLIKSDKSLTARVENIELFPSYYPRISLSSRESFLLRIQFKGAENRLHSKAILVLHIGQQRWYNGLQRRGT